ncbi:hypothetical protein P7K49_034453 [Saguinus oedipus]|uniref:Enhancer of rudimentary homolog n=1 Tax=Saguinus oedipus TaxID=9490 RepID=A0ABQ9TUR9_SAGOE|nr:hypothetical protein P7K49_034453 [Saguinus oedipus]
MEGVCEMYEEHLKRMNPNSPSITYDISQLFDFIDDLADLSCLLYRADTQTYQLITKTGLKRRSTCSFVGGPNRLGNNCVGNSTGDGGVLGYNSIRQDTLEKWF